VFNANEGEEDSIQNLKMKEIEISNSLQDNMNEDEINEFLKEIENKK
jgi:hypothetical protein